MIVYRCSSVLCVFAFMIYNIHRINIHGLEPIPLSLYGRACSRCGLVEGRHCDYILPAPRTMPDYSFNLIYVLQQHLLS